jgi:type IV pilus assembly protein PilM
MAPFGRKKWTVGLDIGSGLIKLVVVDHSKSQPELVKVAITPVLADAIVEGEVMDPGIVADAIRGLFVTAAIKQKGVVTAVGGRDVIVKKIQMDRMKEADAREVIRWEAEQHVPFDMENVQLDFQILDPDGEGLQMNVLLVAAKRELVENKVSLLTDAGLTPQVIDVDAFALHNAFELNYPDELAGMVGLLNVGHEVTNVNILEDGVPILTRDLAIGTRRLREDLQRERGMGAEEADKMLQAAERNQAIDPYVESRGEEMAVGIERAAAFLQTGSRTGVAMSRIYMSGGGSRVPGLSDVLADRLHVPVEHADPLKNVTVREGVFDTLAIEEVAPLLMLPVGLALRAA